MNPRLTISIPVFPGLSVKLHEIELPVARIASSLRQTPEIHDPLAWAPAIRLVLQFILDDMHVDGNLRGGWGKSYAERYLRETYPHGVPDDASRQPDSPSGTAMVVKGLSDFLCVDKLLDNVGQHALMACLSESATYFAARFSAQTGAVGVMTQLAGGDIAIAYNIRHTAMSLRVWQALPNQYERLGRSCRNILESAEAMNLEAERALTVASVFSALHLIESQEDLRRGIPGAHRIPFLQKKAEVALLSQWSDEFGGWYDGKNARATAQWYTAFVLKELSCLSSNVEGDLAKCVHRALATLVDSAQTVEGDQLGIPYFLGGAPDLGMTCMLFDIMAKSSQRRDQRRTFDGLCKFITGCGTRFAVDRQLLDAYPWTLASLFSGLRTLLSTR